MAQIDQFESVFRSALRDVYEYQPVSVRSVLLITDRKAPEIKDYLSDVQRFLSVLGDEVEWRVFNDEARYTTADLLERIGREPPDLICTYRNLHSNAWRYPHSLGEHLDVLLQKTDVPVMILPHPDADYAHDHALENTDCVMVVTDHLVNAHRLVNFAVGFAEEKGTVFLAHIEDQGIFDRYMAAISKIPDIDTDLAAARIHAQLLKGPRDYVASCMRVLADQNLPVQVETIVTFGKHLSEYREYIAIHQVDLLLMSSKDKEQMAMHGPAYPLAIELRKIPLLLL